MIQKVLTKAEAEEMRDNQFFTHLNKVAAQANFVRELGETMQAMHKRRLSLLKARRAFWLRVVLLIALLVASWGTRQLVHAQLIAPVIMSIVLPGTLMASGWVAREAVYWAKKSGRCK